MTARPPIRYVGGKSWLVERLKAEIEATKPKIYVEPFLGGGAIALSIDPSIKKILGDTNRPLMEMWRAIRDAPENLERELRDLEKTYDDSSQYIACLNYLEARKAFNTALANPRPFWVRRAALFLYLNARCYNGLWRVNKLGRFNVPFGKLASPRKISLDELKAISTSLKGSDLRYHPFWNLLLQVARGSAVFCDPPYDGVYEGYSSDGFGEDDQRKLAEMLERLAKIGVNVWATNADTPLIREIYGWADIEAINEHHSVGPTGEQRSKKGCVLIRSQPNQFSKISAQHQAMETR